MKAHQGRKDVTTRKAKKKVKCSSPSLEKLENGKLEAGSLNNKMISQTHVSKLESVALSKARRHMRQKSLESALEIVSLRLV